MNRKVNIVLSVLAFVSVVPLYSSTPQDLQSTSIYKNYYKNEKEENTSFPISPVYGPEPKPESYGDSVMYGPPPKPRYISSPPPPPAKTFSGQRKNSVPGSLPTASSKPSSQNYGQGNQNENVPEEVGAVVEGLVDFGDRLVGSYVNSASSLVDRALHKKSQKEQLEADKAMLNNSVIVGDDTVALLKARDKEDWKKFIDKQFNENPKALVETLLPLAQFNPQDVKELSLYIADKRDVAGVRSIVRGVANTPYWEADQEGIEEQAGASNFANSPEGKAIRNELKNNFTAVAKKAAEDFWIRSEEKAERKSESYWNKLR